MKKSDIGLVGLAVMGENLAINLESKGYRVSLYNRLHPHTPQVVDRFLASQGEAKRFYPTYSLAELVEDVTKEDVVSIARSVECDLIYFLRGLDGEETLEEVADDGQP